MREVAGVTSQGPLKIQQSSTASRLAVDDDPVWPVATHVEFDSLTRLAGVFESSLTVVENARTANFAGSETVVALTSRVIDDARLYAHLTQRTVRLAADRRALDRIEHCCVVVAPDELLDDQLAEQIAERQTPCGIVTGNGPAELRQAVLLRSAAVRLRGQASVGRIDIMPTMDVGCVAIGDRIIFGRSADRDALRLGLNAAAAVLTISTHSDGIDGFLLERKLILCPMNRTVLNANPEGLPACQVNQFCHRLELPIAEALGTGALLAPEEISARLLVLDGCWAAFPPQLLGSREWGFAYRILQSGGVGAILAPWEIVVADVRRADLLIRHLAAGDTVGRAMQRYYRSTHARTTAHRMCLLGDPRLTVPAQSPEAVLPVMPRTRIRAASPSKGVSFLRAFLVEARQRLKEGDDLYGTIQDASQALEAYEREAWRGLDPEQSGAGKRLRKAVVRVLTEKRMTPLDVWRPLFEPLRSSARIRPCHACGRETNTLEARPLIPSAERRRVVFCATCGIVEDSPVDVGFGMVLPGDGSVQLTGELPAESEIALMLEPPIEARRRVWNWPTADAGRPAETFKPDGPWSRGPLRVVVVIVLPSLQQVFLSVISRGETMRVAARLT